MDKKTIVARIDQLIIEKHITTYQLKENAEISSTIYQWRKNPKRDEERIPSLRSIVKICNFLGVSLSYFFTMDTDEQPNKRIEDMANRMKNLKDDQLHLIELLLNQFESQ